MWWVNGGLEQLREDFDGSWDWIKKRLKKQWNGKKKIINDKDCSLVY